MLVVVGEEALGMLVPLVPEDGVVVGRAPWRVKSASLAWPTRVVVVVVAWALKVVAFPLVLGVLVVGQVSWSSWLSPLMWSPTRLTNPNPNPIYHGLMSRQARHRERLALPFAEQPYYKRRRRRKGEGFGWEKMNIILRRGAEGCKWHMIFLCDQGGREGGVLMGKRHDREVMTTGVVILLHRRHLLPMIHR